MNSSYSYHCFLSLHGAHLPFVPPLAFFRSGSLPSELGNLRKLEKFQMYSNSLTGTVPSEYSGMIRLQEVNLVANSLSGSFPTGLWTAGSGGTASGENDNTERVNTNLKSIRLSNNKFSGNLPTTEFGLLRNVEELLVDGNELVGTLPTELALMTKLQVLSLSRNGFTGQVPTELVGLSRLGKKLDFAFFQEQRCPFFVGVPVVCYTCHTQLSVSPARPFSTLDFDRRTTT